MTLFEPWILARLVAGVAAAALFVHGGWVSSKVLRYFRVGATSEGQLALERQAELAAASARVGALLQAGALLLSVTAADRLASHIRGAMCGYGVVHIDAVGPSAVVASALASLAAAVLGQALALDRVVRGLSLVRPLAWFTLVVAALSLGDLTLTALWLGGLDFSVVASCCSSGLDAGEGAARWGAAAGPRVLATASAVALALGSAAASWAAARSARRSLALAAGAASALALPASVAAIVLEVAPHVYEVPHHRCPYCLFRPDALGLGYLLFGALLLACTWTLGSALAALLLPRDADGDQAFARFAPRRLRRGAAAWLVVLALGAAPVVRYLILSGGAPLFRLEKNRAAVSDGSRGRRKEGRERRYAGPRARAAPCCLTPRPSLACGHGGDLS